MPVTVRKWARILLALIRLVNGIIALLMPNLLGRRLGVNTTTSPGFGYAFRLFGVRTVLLGIDLLRAPDDPGNPIVRRTLAIHPVDTIAALVVLKRKELPPAGAKMAIAASALNAVLSVIINLPGRGSARTLPDRSSP